MKTELRLKNLYKVFPEPILLLNISKRPFSSFLYNFSGNGERFSKVCVIFVTLALSDLI